MIVSAKWTNDCQGKKDYDGSLIEISTRYWPGKAALEKDELAGAWIVGGDKPGLQVVPYSENPSAHSSIQVMFGEDNWYDLASQEFEAETEEEVKRQVEFWVKERCEEILLKLGVPRDAVSECYQKRLVWADKHE